MMYYIKDFVSNFDMDINEGFGSVVFFPWNGLSGFAVKVILTSWNEWGSIPPCSVSGGVCIELVFVSLNCLLEFSSKTS